MRLFDTFAVARAGVSYCVRPVPVLFDNVRRASLRSSGRSCIRPAGLVQRLFERQQRAECSCSGVAGDVSMLSTLANFFVPTVTHGSVEPFALMPNTLLAIMC